MDDTTLLKRMAVSTRGFTDMHAGASEGASKLTLADGAVHALITPATPKRSVLNAVDYSDADAFADSLPELARAYADAGVEAWTVWVPEPDTGTAARLEREGHVLDAAPRAMGAVLQDCDLGEGAAGIDYSTDHGARTVGELNERAYGYDEGSFATAFERFPDSVHIYVASVGGEPAATVSTSYHDGDCGIWWVATVPEARGSGLSGALLRQALIDAREAGCDSTTLQATVAGYPTYERIGYRDLGGLQMWERRS